MNYSFSVNNLFSECPIGHHSKGEKCITCESGLYGHKCSFTCTCNSTERYINNYEHNLIWNKNVCILHLKWIICKFYFLFFFKAIFYVLLHQLQLFDYFVSTHINVRVYDLLLFKNYSAVHQDLYTTWIVSYDAVVDFVQATCKVIFTNT